MNENNDLLKKGTQLATTVFPGGADDVAAFANDPKQEQFYNGVIIPPMESDYLQYQPNNKLLHFMNLSLSAQDRDNRSFEVARRRAQELYTNDVVSPSFGGTGDDHSLFVIKSMIKDYSNSVTVQEFEEIGLGLRELTSEQLLRMIDEQARMVKTTANDRLQMIMLIFMVLTTAITAYTLVTTGPGAVPVEGAKKVGTTALRKFLASCAGKLSTLYASTVGRAFLIAELAGDVTLTMQEVSNCWSEMTDPHIRADADTWAQITRYMNATRENNSIVYSYYMKPSEMIGLFAIWERGDRSVLDSRLRNLIYGKSAYFKTDLNNFSKVKFRIGKIGKYVERQIGTPSLFPAFGLMLRIFSRMAAARGSVVLGRLLSAGLWLTRLERVDDLGRR